MMLVPRRSYDLFDDFFNDSFPIRGESYSNTMMKTDIRETDSSYIIDVDLPGVMKENIKVDVDGGYLNISSQVRQDNNDNREGNFIRRERYFGECSRSFYIGEDVKREDIKATFRNGILSLVVPKVQINNKNVERKYIEIGD